MPTISGTVRDENNDLLADAVVRAYRRDTGALLVAGLSGDGSEEEPGDADYASVSLLLHCDGADGATTFVDNSPTPKTITVYGNAHIETDQSKFGGASAFFSATNDGRERVSAPAEAGNLNAYSTFTVEAWVRVTNWDDYSFFISQGSGSSNRGWGINVNASQARFYYTTDGSSDELIYAPHTFALDTWYHIAVVSTAGQIAIYVDGASKGTGTLSGAIFNSTGPLQLGSFMEYTGISHCFRGYVDEVRITKGVARYTAAFTPPTAAFLDYATIPAKPIGEYRLTTSYTGEVNVITLDPTDGTTFNDLILRTTPV